MNQIPSRQMINDVLIERAAYDRDIVVLCSDSRGSASLASFAEKYPERFIEVGIAEQNLVGIAAGLARCGKKSYAASPACFLTSRGYEQCKIDCAYSDTNVKLIGISGGVSYGALGMSHHSTQDIAAMAAIPNMRVYLPCDPFQTRRLVEALLADDKPAYVRVGRNPVKDVYTEDNVPFVMDRATVLSRGDDVAIIACGEMVRHSLDAAMLLKEQGIGAAVLDMYCVKPLDRDAILDAAKRVKAVFTVEEHSPYGGLGSMVAQLLGARQPKKVINLSLPDEPAIAGNSEEVFAYYGLDGKGIAMAIQKRL